MKIFCSLKKPAVKNGLPTIIKSLILSYRSGYLMEQKMTRPS
ncbi:hypothetical protein B4144_1184 [Bacillus atrophaeus]|nr:hypothetical protein B4144_1184 [Bacillus atrophaeus]